PPQPHPAGSRCETKWALPPRPFVLSVNGDRAELAAVGLDEGLALHEEAAGAHGGIVNLAGVGLEHLDDDGDDALGRVVLAALLALGQGELAEEVFVNVAEDVLGVEAGVA